MDFVNGKETRESSVNLRLIFERHLVVLKDVYSCFLHHAKSFDIGRHGPLVQCLSEIEKFVLGSGNKQSLWAAVFTFNHYLLISINELFISIISLLISIKMDADDIFIDINNSFIDINKYGCRRHLYLYQ